MRGMLERQPDSWPGCTVLKVENNKGKQKPSSSTAVDQISFALKNPAHEPCAQKVLPKNSSLVTLAFFSSGTYTSSTEVTVLLLISNGRRESHI